MRNSFVFLLALAVALVGLQCGNAPTGTVLQGNIQNAANLQIFVDKVALGTNTTSQILGKSTIDETGNFSVAFPEGLPAGIYRLRIGAKKANLVLDGNEKTVNIKGDLATLNRYQFELSGSQDSKIYLKTMQALIARKLKATDIKTFLDTTASPLVGMLVAMQSLPSRSFVDVHKAAKARLAKAYPNGGFVKDYQNFISNLERVQSGRSYEFVAVENRQNAPDIQLPNPEGKKYSLSGLKGNVVLLDFWASWCGPCRRENPNVVNVYKKYKDKGFTVFSVSLDGLDSRTKARFSSQEQIDKQMERQKKRWINAIKQDGLLWEYHVSDLKKWESDPARAYGVNSIPRTFLIDRDGKIAAKNLRGAQQIEDALQKLL